MLVYIVFIWYAQVVFGFGVGFHLTQVGRVFSHYDSFTKAGSLFPDSVLQYGKLNICWDKFLSDGVELWNRKYGSHSATVDDYGLRQFLLGVHCAKTINELQNTSSHGLLTQLSDLEFEGNMDNALTYLRGSSDLIHLSRVLSSDSIELAFYMSTEVKLPMKEDVLNLLSLQDISVDWGNIVDNMLGMIGVLHSELYLLRDKRFHALDIAYSLSPGGSIAVREHHIGGEWAILGELQNSIPAFNSSFIDGTDQLARPEGRAGLNVSSQRYEAQDYNYVSSLKENSLFGSTIVSGNFLDGDPCVAVGSPIEDGRGSVYVIPMKLLQPQSTSYTNKTNYTISLYGSRVHKFTLLNDDYLIVSEPGRKSFHIYYGSEKILTILDLTSNFPELSYIADIDNDQIPDLIISCGTCRDKELGKVTIIPGMNLIPYLISGKKNQVELIESIGNIPLSGPISLKYQHFGSNTIASRSFLFVAAENLGLVYVYKLEQLSTFSPPVFYIKEQDIVTPDEGIPWKWEVMPSKKHGNFGCQMYTWTYNNVDYISISQPLFNKVYIYKDAGTSALEVWLVLELDSLIDLNTIQYSIEFGKGIYFSNTDEKLYLSSPGSFNGAGVIWSVSMSEMKRVVEFWKSHHLLVTALKHLHFINPQKNRKGWSNFGATLAGSEFNELIISVPGYGYGDLYESPLSGSILIK